MNQTGTLLIVEDDSDQLALFSMVLSAAGYTVVSAPDAEMALPILEDRAFDVLLTDLMLPGIHGDTLITAVQEQYPETRTVLMSNRHNVLEVAHACGADGALPKGDLKRMTNIVGLVMRGAHEKP